MSGVAAAAGSSPGRPCSAAGAASLAARCADRGEEFRYAAEIGELTGMGALEASIRALKKGQEILGDLHDRQALVDKLPSLATPEHPDIASDHIRAVIQALEAECRELHGKYVSRR